MGKSKKSTTKSSKKPSEKRSEKRLKKRSKKIKLSNKIILNKVKLYTYSLNNKKVDLLYIFNLLKTNKNKHFVKFGKYIKIDQDEMYIPPKININDENTIYIGITDLDFCINYIYAKTNEKISFIDKVNLKDYLNKNNLEQIISELNTKFAQDEVNKIINAFEKFRKYIKSIKLLKIKYNENEINLEYNENIEEIINIEEIKNIIKNISHVKNPKEKNIKITTQYKLESLILDSDIFSTVIFNQMMNDEKPLFLKESININHCLKENCNFQLKNFNDDVVIYIVQKKIKTKINPYITIKINSFHEEDNEIYVKKVEKLLNSYVKNKEKIKGEIETFINNKYEIKKHVKCDEINCEKKIKIKSKNPCKNCGKCNVKLKKCSPPLSTAKWWKPGYPRNCQTMTSPIIITDKDSMNIEPYSIKEYPIDSGNYLACTDKKYPYFYIKDDQFPCCKGKDPEKDIDTSYNKIYNNLDLNKLFSIKIKSSNKQLKKKIAKKCGLLYIDKDSKIKPETALNGLMIVKKNDAMIYLPESIFFTNKIIDELNNICKKKCKYYINDWINGFQKIQYTIHSSQKSSTYLRAGELPENLKRFLSLLFLDKYKYYDHLTESPWYRYNISKDPKLSLLYSLEWALEMDNRNNNLEKNKLFDIKLSSKNIRKSLLKGFHKDPKKSKNIALSLCKHNMYDFSNEKIEEIINNGYIDPSLFHHLLETKYKVNIIVFHRENIKKKLTEKTDNVKILLPKYYSQYIYRKKFYKKTIIIYEHFGHRDEIINKIPQCEVIFYKTKIKTCKNEIINPIFRDNISSYLVKIWRYSILSYINNFKNQVIYHGVKLPNIKKNMNIKQIIENGMVTKLYYKNTILYIADVILPVMKLNSIELENCSRDFYTIEDIKRNLGSEIENIEDLNEKIYFNIFNIKVFVLKNYSYIEEYRKNSKISSSLLGYTKYTFCKYLQNIQDYPKIDLNNREIYFDFIKKCLKFDKKIIDINCIEAKLPPPKCVYNKKENHLYLNNNIFAKDNEKLKEILKRLIYNIELFAFNNNIEDYIEFCSIPKYFDSIHNFNNPSNIFTYNNKIEKINTIFSKLIFNFPLKDYNSFYYLKNYLFGDKLLLCKTFKNMKIFEKWIKKKSEYKKYKKIIINIGEKVELNKYNLFETNKKIVVFGINTSDSDLPQTLPHLLDPESKK